MPISSSSLRPSLAMRCQNTPLDLYLSLSSPLLSSSTFPLFHSFTSRSLSQLRHSSFLSLLFRLEPSISRFSMPPSLFLFFHFYLFLLSCCSHRLKGEGLAPILFPSPPVTLSHFSLSPFGLSSFYRSLTFSLLCLCLSSEEMLSQFHYA